MRIAYNPIDCQPLSDTYKNNDITFDLSGKNIFVKGVKFSGVEDLVTKYNPGWVPIIKDAKQDVTNDFYLLTSDGNTSSWNKFPELFFDRYTISGDWDDGYKIELKSLLKNNSELTIPFMVGATEENSGSPGLVPSPSKGELRYLDSKGIWSTPTDMYVLNTVTEDKIYYLTGTSIKNSNTGIQLFNIKNYINPLNGIYSNDSLVLNQDDDQEIIGLKSFITPPIIGNKNIITWNNNGDYTITYDTSTSWNKNIIVNKKNSNNKQFFGWKGSGDVSNYAYLGINVSNFEESQYRFTNDAIFINNNKVITENTIIDYIDDKYVNVEGDIMTGPLSIKIKNYGIVLGSRVNEGNIQLGNLNDSNSKQIGSITGYKESILSLFTLKSELVQVDGNIISGGFISTCGKVKNNDTIQGVILEKGNITLNGITPGLYFHYNGSTRTTSSILEEVSGTLSIDAITRVLGGSYYGEGDHYFNHKGNIKACNINVTDNLEVLGQTILTEEIVNGNIIYNKNQEQNIEVSSVFVTKIDKNKESNIITKISIDDFAFELTNKGIISVSKSLNITTDWTDTGISELVESGTYIIQISDTSKRLYSGIMSWSNKSSSVEEEILLHRAGSSTSNTIYLRTLGNSIQIAGSNNTSSTFTFNFKKVI